MFTRLLVLGSLIAAMVAPAAAAPGERRVALVIGNSAYSHAANLRNPKNDAGDMADALGKLGFKVLMGVDLDQQKFARTIDQFGRMLDEADVGLFFYAGHGLQINDKNFLVSTNAQLASEFLISSETIDLESVVRLMESKAPTNIVFLDACRNNPLAEDLRKNLAALNRSVALGRGLARVERTGRDTLVAFAAAPGQEAADGNERNSPFTSALLKHLPSAGVEISVMLKQVAADVRRVTNNNQRPQQLSDMTRLFYFAKAEEPAPVQVASADPASGAAKPAAPGAAPAPVSAPAGTTDDRTIDVAFWNAAQAQDHCEAMRAYLRRFPNGVFVELARLSEQRLCAPARRIEVVGTDPIPPAEPPRPAAKAEAPPAEPGRVAQPEVKVAAVPSPVAPLAAAPATKPAVPDVARNAQLELIRLGCGQVEADGIWGTSSKDAVKLFNKHAKAKLEGNEPSDKLLVALRAKDDRVCPVSCERGYRAKGNTCVAIAKKEPAPRKRSAQRAQERRPARVVHEQPAAPPPHQPGVSPGGAGVGLMLMYGAGRMRFR